MRSVLFLALALLLAAPAAAQNLALVLTNSVYASGPAPERFARVASAVDRLRARGFEVISGQDLAAADMRAQLGGLFDRMQQDGAERVVIVLAGRMVQSQSGSWLLGVQADAPGLALADGAGVRLDTVMEIAARAELAAQLWLSPWAAPAGDGLRPGLPPRLMVPRGVGVVRGAPDAVLDGLDAILQPGTVLAEVVDATDALRGEGSVPALVPFLPEGFAPVARADRDAWAQAQDEDTEAAYRAYLDRFPNGLSAQQARNRIAALRNTPERIEADLALTADERRAIQRDLTTLGLDTRGIDGLFGPGTRAAIRVWQGRNDLEQTGYLTRDQIFTLAGQAARRAEEIAAEEREARAAAAREDRAFWQATGAGEDAAGLRAYLGRYPEGIFAELARERLDTIAAENRAARDRAAWERAQETHTVAAYERYLSDHPEGAFAGQARARLARLRPAPEPEPVPVEPPQPDLDAARRAEAALGLPRSSRLLIERRLRAKGHAPGTVDGNFDADTRTAIRAAQGQFGLPQTGYVSGDFVAMMLDDAFRGFFE